MTNSTTNAASANQAKAPSLAANEPEATTDGATQAPVASEPEAAGEDTEHDTPAFSELGLSEGVLKAVADLGYENPSPVQAQAIPYVLEGRDLLAAAQTGTGKTAAFLLPSLSRLPHAARHHGPTMLVVTPTRELAQQIDACCKTIAKRTRHHSFTVVGGVGYEPQKAALHRGCDVLVATPGRLVDLIDQGEANLSEVQVLVLDEADRMLDMGFLPAMRKIVGQTPATRQTLLFSATLDEKQIGGIRDLVHDPAIVEIAHKGTVAETIDQYVLPVSLEVKNGLLAEVLHAEQPSRVIVFCRTKHRADTVCRRLRRAGISCAPIHGDRSQRQRERALKSFSTGETDVLVATDVLARGIDVSDVRYVVNFDVPMDPEDYIHRIGRTGRAGEMGWALTFVTVNDLDDLLACERLMGQVVPTYEPKQPLDLGTQPPVLDPDRSPDAPAPGKKKHKRGGRSSQAPSGASQPQRRRGAGLGTDATTSGSRKRSKGHGEGEEGGKAASGKRGGSSKPRSREIFDADEGEFLTEGELFGREGHSGRGGRGGRNSRKGTGAPGRGDARGREQRKAPQDGGRNGKKRSERGGREEFVGRRDSGRGGFDGGRGRGGKGGRRRSAVEEQTPAVVRPTKKRGRRPGDRRGRDHGVY